MEQKSTVKKSEFGIKIELNKLPESWSLGQYTSFRTGSKEQMENLKRSIVQSNLKTLMRHG